MMVGMFISNVMQVRNLRVPDRAMIAELIIVKDAHREGAPSDKYGHLCSWYIKSTLLKRFLC